MDRVLGMVNSIVDLIPYGYENAISRANLTKMCDEFGLIEPDTKDKDRAMRDLVRKAKLDWAILSRQDGGYFQPDIRKAEDVKALREYKHREENRAKSIFAGLKKPTELLEDVKHNRFGFENTGYNPYQE